MEINIKDMENKSYIELIGKLDGNCSNEVTDEVLEALDKNNNIVIDMSECPYVSSAGLRALLTIGKKVKIDKGHMSIINLSEEVKDVMDMTGFGGIFKEFEE